MILFEISREVELELKAKGVPYPVVYGPERTKPTTVGPNSRIVIERDRDGGDTMAGARSVHTNAKLVGVTAVGCVARIFGQSTKGGAGIHDHEGICDQVRSKLRAALDLVIRGNQTLWAVQRAKFLNQQELEMLGLTTWPGAVYEIRFTVDAGDYDTNFQGEAADEATFGPGGVTIKNTTQVTANGAGVPETACGD